MEFNVCGGKKSYITPVKKVLFIGTCLSFLGIITLLTLVISQDTNPFDLSHWIIIAFVSFALFFSNYILIDRSKIAPWILLVSLINFGLVLLVLNSPSLFDSLWNSVLTLLIVILGLALYALVPLKKSIIHTFTRISILLSFLLLTLICSVKIEAPIIYQLTFYALIATTVLLLISVLGKQSIADESTR